MFNFAIELKEDDESAPSKSAPSKSTPSKAQRIIGAVGSFHLPDIGYMIHPDYAGKGYATEAVMAVIPGLFERIPPLCEGGMGFDHLEGWTDVNNWPSRRILQKCGFTCCETIPDPENTVRGPSEIAVFRKARPGRTLDALGLVPSKATDSSPQAPLQ